jgi:hypothetical protein
MVTLRAYSNPAEAALAKSLLDDYNVPCSLAGENAYLYGGAPFAMPVRILVADEQAEHADHLLKNAGGPFADIEPTPDGKVQATIETISDEGLLGREQQPSLRSTAENNPWEILAVASLLLLPGLVLLVQKHGLILVGWRGGRISRRATTIFSPATAHLLGAFVIALSLLLTILFFYARRAIAREQTAAALLRDQSM